MSSAASSASVPSWNPYYSDNDYSMSPPPQRIPKVSPPTVQQRLEDFFYTGTWNIIQLKGRPNFPYEY
jgi:hypothetical protein